MKQEIAKYIELTKPKVTLLNLFVGITCFALAAFPKINTLNLALFTFTGYLACGGCGVLNCVYDKNVDRLMERTSERVVPSGKISTRKALIFGMVLTGGGICLSYLFFNLLTATMIILGTICYLGIYTMWLKRSSSWNVVIGGTAGCFAALSGWTAAVNALSLTPLLIATVDFLWTPGHLWGLAMKKVEDYRKAGIPMLSVTLGLKKTAQIAFTFNFVTILSSLLFPVLGLAGFLYSAIALFAGVWFLFENNKLLRLPNGENGFKVFLFSMPYLTILMLGLILDKIH